MKRLFKLLTAAVAGLLLVSVLTACAPTQQLDMSKVASVIDVRTPEEFATGHLEGALNIDFEGGDFETQIQALDHGANYVLYCRSGNRAGQVLQYMQENGFTGTITNAGAVADASAATGIKIVQ
ncbi:MAG: rhodanese-like domain-containing protein [Micrococcales bacterium]